MDTTHLKKRHQTWYARVAVPPALQATVGKSEIVRSLRTRDLAEANRRKHRIVAEIHERLSQLATQASLPKESAEYVRSLAEEARAQVERGELRPGEAWDALDAAREKYLEEMATKNGHDPDTGRPHLDETQERTLTLAHKILHEGNVLLVSKALTLYLKETQGRITKQTYQEKERELTEFKEWLGFDCEVSTITRALCGRYVTEILMTKGHAAKTVRDTLSHLGSWFAWLEDRGSIESNPWRNQARSVKDSKRGKKKRDPWSDEELLSLLTKLPPNDPLWSMTAIGTYTGMRREEVCALRVEDVKDDDAFDIREGKTNAAVRRVPIHPALKPLVERLMEQSKDGFLLSGLLTGGADEKRSHLIGKRFGLTIRNLGFSDEELNFHALRKAFLQRCETAGVPESSAKLLVGHKRDSLTYGLYSPGPMFEALRKELEKVTFGELDALVKKQGRQVEIEAKSRRRRRRITPPK